MRQHFEYKNSENGKEISNKLKKKNKMIKK